MLAGHDKTTSSYKVTGPMLTATEMAWVWAWGRRGLHLVGELSAWTRELGRQVSPTHRERPFQTHTRCDSSESPVLAVDTHARAVRTVGQSVCRRLETELRQLGCWDADMCGERLGERHWHGGQGPAWR